MGRRSVCVPLLRRLPAYLRVLKNLEQDGREWVTCSQLADTLKYHVVLVRKDIAACSSVKGRPKKGYRLAGLIADVERMLGYREPTDAVLAGLGRLGQAIFGYPGFEAYGIRIVAGFDVRQVQVTPAGKGEVLPCGEIVPWCMSHGIRLGIIAVPQDAAQEVCDAMVRAGIKAIWNFAPAHLRVPDDVDVQNENMAIPLARLTKHLSARPDAGRGQ